MLDALLNRRSIRHYTPEPVTKEQLELLLRAAMAAPSAHNRQPWHFIVVTDRALLDGIPDIHPYSLMLKEASAAIVVCGELAQEKTKGFWVQDCSAATQNILTAAQELGLGAVWLGVYPVQGLVKKVIAMFGIPGGVIPLGMVSVGHPAEQKEPANRFNPERIHENRWA